MGHRGRPSDLVVELVLTVAAGVAALVYSLLLGAIGERLAKDLFLLVLIGALAGGVSARLVPHPVIALAPARWVVLAAVPAASGAAWAIHTAQRGDPAGEGSAVEDHPRTRGFLLGAALPLAFFVARLLLTAA